LTDDGPVPSAEQDRWIELVERLQSGLQSHIEKMPNMCPCDLDYFASAWRTVFGLAVAARSYDVEVERKSTPW